MWTCPKVSQDEENADQSREKDEAVVIMPIDERTRHASEYYGVVEGRDDGLSRDGGPGDASNGREREPEA